MNTENQCSSDFEPLHSPLTRRHILFLIGAWFIIAGIVSIGFIQPNDSEMVQRGRVAIPITAGSIGLLTIASGLLFHKNSRR